MSLFNTGICLTNLYHEPIFLQAHKGMKRKYFSFLLLFFQIKSSLKTNPFWVITDHSRYDTRCSVWHPWPDNLIEHSSSPRLFLLVIITHTPPQQPTRPLPPITKYPAARKFWWVFHDEQASSPPPTLTHVWTCPCFSKTCWWCPATQRTTNTGIQP